MPIFYLHNLFDKVSVKAFGSFFNQVCLCFNKILFIKQLAGHICQGLDLLTPVLEDIIEIRELDDHIK